MLGILVIFFIGKYFYQLAEKYNQNKLLFAILGVVAYYVGGAIAGVVLAIFSMIIEFEVDWDNTLLMGILGLPAGLLSCWLFYYLLEKNWKKKEVKPLENIDDIGRDLEE
ncbi:MULTISPECIES: hypothetical protein [Flavobacterium]|uniref:Uncharacterized protein n=1 Tax=Flavobacterium jumunjinense TaxID=998845 RepID=A0ABV5GIE0_9FLAO|nr:MULTISPECIES: hypothetical protein [Flavobacterium]